MKKAEKTNTEIYNSIVRDSLDFASVGIIICTSKGVVVFINPSALKVMGEMGSWKEDYSPVGKDITKESGAFKTVFQKVRKEKSLNNYSFPYSTESGDQHWICCNAYVHGGEGDIVIIISDVTTYKLCETTLRRSERELCSIINLIPDIIYRLNHNGIITFVSEEVKYYGYNPDELIGTDIMDMVHPEDRKKAMHKLKERRTGERRTSSFEVRLMTKNREAVTFEIKDRVIHDYPVFSISAEGLYQQDDNGDRIFVGTQGIARDISRRKSAEFALLKNEERWRTILEGLEDGYYEVDVNGNFTYVNNALCEMAELDYEEIIGNSYNIFFKEDDAESMFKSFNQVLKSEVPSKLTDWSGVSRSGKKRKIEGSISLIKEVDGTILGFRGIVRDITERDKMERELTRAKKLEAIGILAGGIAHDYNNALTAIMGNISLAKMEIDPQNSDLLEILNDAESASMRVMELTKRLSIFAKGGRPMRSVVKLGDLVKETADLMLEKFSGDYRIDISDGLWKVEIDEFQISQVISNVLQNAMEAMPEGGGIYVIVENVVVDKEQSHHEIVLQPDSYVMISIRDEGEGIETEDLYSIFDPFFTTKPSSIGMGLATSYAIIKRHHGYIDVKTVKGEGTTFFIYLPVVDSEQQS